MDVRERLSKVLRTIARRRRIEDLVSSMPLSELRKRAKIVAIDDEEDSFPTVALQEDGYTIEWWERVNSARLERLEGGDFDIIILDIQDVVEEGISDTGDGLGVLRRIKNVKPQQVVVAFSGKTFDLSAVPFWRLADDALQKPVTMIQCKEVLDRLINDTISVRGYWENIATLLGEEGVPPRRRRNLEKRIVKAAEKGRSISLEELRQIVGTVEDLGTIFMWTRKILALCTLGS